MFLDEFFILQCSEDIAGRHNSKCMTVKRESMESVLSCER